MKKNQIFRTILQLGGAVACAALFVFITKTQVKPVTVYQFERSLGENTVVQEGDIKKVTIPKDAVTGSFVTDKSEIVGKAVSADAFKGSYIIKEQLIEKENIDPFSTMDVTNLRKVTIPVDWTSGLAGNIKSGDKVDLTYVNEIDAETNKTFYAKTFMQDIFVYSVVDDGGRKYIDQSQASEVVSDENGEVVESGDIAEVVLAVTPSQAEEILARLSAGKVSLVGRFDGSQNSSSNGYTIGEYGEIPVEQVNPEK